MASGPVRAAGPWTGLLLAALAGAAVEIVVCATTGEREAWDSSAYWMAGYPALVLSCGVLGALFPAGAWLLGFAAVGAQLLTMVVRNEIGPLWVIGVVLGVALAAPCALVAQVSALLFAAKRRSSP